MAGITPPDNDKPAPGERLPASLSAGRIRSAEFPRTRRGFDPRAVRAFLGLVADEIMRLQQQLADAESSHRPASPAGDMDSGRRPPHDDWPINPS